MADNNRESSVHPAQSDNTAGTGLFADTRDPEDLIPCEGCPDMDSEEYGIFCGVCGKFFCISCWQTKGDILMDIYGNDIYYCESCWR